MDELHAVRIATTALLAFALAYASVRLLLSRYGRFVLDLPNERSLHQRPTPRTGGIAILVGAVASVVSGGAALWTPLALAGALATVSFFDDLHGLPTRVRLAAHLTAAGIFAWLVLAPIDPALFVIAVLALGWLTNLYNFMDGADGLAGGMAVFGFGAYAWAALLSGEMPLASVCAALAASAAAFLCANFPPARIFMGDIGSIPLGFLAGALGLIGWREGVWPLWFPLLVFAPFVCDATLTLVKRAMRRQRVWQAHKEHYYQRLVRMGYGHRGTAYIEYAAMGACAVAAVFVRDAVGVVQVGVLAGVAATLSMVAVWVDAQWVRRARNEGEAEQ